KLVQHGQHQSRARRAERMAERNRAAVDVGAFTVKPKLTLNREVLAGEGFVHFDEINLFKLQAGSGERFLRSRHRAYAHDLRRHASHAAAARCWLCRANSSCVARVMSYLRTRFSAVCAI